SRGCPESRGFADIAQLPGISCPRAGAVRRVLVRLRAERESGCAGRAGVIVRRARGLVTTSQILLAFAQLARLRLRSPRAPAAENLLLGKQLARFQERRVKPHRAKDSTGWVIPRTSARKP